MNRKISVFTSAIFILSALSGLAMTKPPQANAAIASASSASAPADAQFAIQTQGATMPLLEPTDQIFALASQDLTDNRLKEAATDLQTGLDLFARSFPNSQMPQDLQQAADNMKPLLAGLNNGTITATDDVRIAVSNFNLAVAHYYLFQAQDAWTQANTELTGYDMELMITSYKNNLVKSTASTGDNLEVALEAFQSAIQWMPTSTSDPAITQVLDQGSKLAASLVLGQGYDVSTITPYMNHLTKSLESFQAGPMSPTE